MATSSLKDHFSKRFSFFILGEKANLKRSLDQSNKVLAQLEESSLSQLKETDELRSNIRELESARQEVRRDNQQLQNQVLLSEEKEF